MNNKKSVVQAMQLPVNKLRPFEGHPFRVKDDAEMDQLVWSILTQGLLTPISVRPTENSEYEVISGHRRLHACQKAGIETVPALIYALDRVCPKQEVRRDRTSFERLDNTKAHHHQC